MESRIFLETGPEFGGTGILDLYASAPYRIMSPFRDGRRSEIVQMSSSAGILAGDTLDAEFIFREGSDIVYTSQGYEKIFDTRERYASRCTLITAEAGTRIRFLPKPVIPFRNSDYRARTEIRLSASSDFMISEIITCGRTGMGEYYKLRQYDSRMRVLAGGFADFADHTRIRPDSFNYTGIGMWGSRTHSGLLYYHPSEEQDRGKMKEMILSLRRRYQDLITGVTCTEQGIVVKSLGMTGEEIREFHSAISENT